MRTLLALLAIVGSVVVAGCVQRVPGPASIGPGTPHISWVIMSGSHSDADSDFVCQSNPRTDCVVLLGDANTEVFSNTHFYYHGAGGETKYAGSVQLGFLHGPADSQNVPVSVTVKGSEQVGRQSVLGRVATKPGTFMMTIDLVATVADTGKNQSLREDVRVVVR